MEWQKYLSDWKAIGALDSHASAVLFRMIKHIEHSATDLPQFCDDNYIHSLSMLFELLASFAQESLLQIMKNPHGMRRPPLLHSPSLFALCLTCSPGAAAVVHREDQKRALALLSKIEDMVETTIATKVLGVELYVALCVRSMRVTVCAGTSAFNC